ncbi:hypothetical protein OROGR_018968 [Orobanche gracilis]
MEPSVITKGRYTYVHDVKKGPPEAIDVHHIMVARRIAAVLMFCTYALLFIIASVLVLLLLQVLMPDKPLASALCSFTLAGFLSRRLLRKQLDKGEEVRNRGL